ncbi:hypothetical protein EVAR_81726_1 [Eumeta japonica]|uniref:Uncharacterized protein n=1 Tax=Eumeta variegata TaxID=151549 RepID=A0A4C1UIS8_EUMVA|nr:hypothetical protein EVAR_81726_1 [Eumeta japonica]
MKIDNYDVSAEYKKSKDSLQDPAEPNLAWYRAHVRESQYFLQKDNDELLIIVRHYETSEDAGWLDEDEVCGASVRLRENRILSGRYPTVPSVYAVTGA